MILLPQAVNGGPLPPNVIAEPTTSFDERGRLVLGSGAQITAGKSKETLVATFGSTQSIQKSDVRLENIQQVTSQNEAVLAVNPWGTSLAMAPNVNPWGTSQVTAPMVPYKSPFGQTSLQPIQPQQTVVQHSQLPTEVQHAGQANAAMNLTEVIGPLVFQSLFILPERAIMIIVHLLTSVA